MIITYCVSPFIVAGGDFGMFLTYILGLNGKNSPCLGYMWELMYIL